MPVQAGNLGMYAMNYFFRRHTCGPTCAALGLVPELCNDAAHSLLDADGLADHLAEWHLKEDIAN